MRWTAWSDGRFEGLEAPVRCALGRAGVVAAAAKREGDGATPLGAWPLREALFRPDRGPPPATALPLEALGPEDGWSDDPTDPLYNQPLMLPHAWGHERLWREDGLYDLIVPLGYNDDPAVPGLGSAIFLHCAAPGHAPTVGCVALARDDLLQVLARAAPGDVLEVRLAADRLEPAPSP